MAKALSNSKVMDNLRDGLPYPYTEKDGTDYISAMLSADQNDTFAFAITLNDKRYGIIVFANRSILLPTCLLDRMVFFLIVFKFLVKIRGILAVI